MKKYTGNSQEKYTQMQLALMRTDAWRSLSSTAQALYLWVRMEWKGARYNNNGKISLSTRQAAKAMGVTPNTVAKAFRELQQKGFLVVVAPAYLGVSGQGVSPKYRITELGVTHSLQIETPDGKKDVPEGRPSREYAYWRKGSDYPIVSPVSKMIKT